MGRAQDRHRKFRGLLRGGKFLAIEGKAGIVEAVTPPGGIISPPRQSQAKDSVALNRLGAPASLPASRPRMSLAGRDADAPRNCGSWSQRSEERRVGKECRSRSGSEYQKERER